MGVGCELGVLYLFYRLSIKVTPDKWETSHANPDGSVQESIFKNYLEAGMRESLESRSSRLA